MVESMTWETNPDVPQGTPGLTFQCGLCSSLVTDRSAHEAWHLTTGMISIESIGAYSVERKYGIEFDDESADDLEFDTYSQAMEKFKEFRAIQAKELKKYGEDNYAGMRIMTKIVVVAESPWSAYIHQSDLNTTEEA